MSLIHPEQPDQSLQREQLIHLLRGKYAFVPSSSDDFAKRKLLEIQREEGWEEMPE